MPPYEPNPEATEPDGTGFGTFAEDGTYTPRQIQNGRAHVRTPVTQELNLLHSSFPPRLSSDLSPPPAPAPPTWTGGARRVYAAPARNTGVCLARPRIPLSPTALTADPCPTTPCPPTSPTPKQLSPMAPGSAHSPKTAPTPRARSQPPTSASASLSPSTTPWSRSTTVCSWRSQRSTGAGTLV